MKNPKRIVVGTDLSECSQSAIESAANLARQYGASVCLAHVFDPSPFVPPAAIPNPARMEAQIATELEGAVRKELERVRDETLTDLPSEQVSLHILRHPSPAKAIVDLAEELDADLIVVGTHGRTGLSHLLIGSVAEKVVRHASCAVLAVRPPKS